MQQNVMPMMGIPTAASASHDGQLVIRDPQQQQQQQQQQQMFDAQQQLGAVVAAREQQDLLKGYEQQQQQQQGQQQEIVRFNGGFEGGAGSVTATGFNQMTTAANMSPSLALGSFDNPYQIQKQQQDHHPLQAQLLIQPQQGQPQQQNQQPKRSESEKGRSSGPC
ncbi:hypothetical protein HRI_001964200 [Hibiscus trionum]|uniref:Uncharacterized protein n=1 Tax=Hibiscus trionum TaxID=183268 RepID=A0A9W7HRP6_HIBTR|nr:hypothetical protein HRI_001964200 [Hibiscus trionum]